MIIPRRIISQRNARRAFAAVLSGVLAAPALAAQPDAWITTKSKMVLLATEGVSATAVSVDTTNQHVTLHGKVRSAAEKEKAEAVVKAIDGVHGVRNLLEVVTPKQEKAVEHADADIKVQVGKALAASALLKDSNVTVESVNNGVVLLGGKTTTLGDHLSAIEIASAIPGVHRVASGIESPDRLADKEIWRERSLKLSDADDSAVDASRDIWITSMTKMRLLADRETPALDIAVDTRNGVVTLFGIVPDRAAKAAAEADARKVSGVRSVRNELQIVSSVRKPAVEAKDADVQSAVKKSLNVHTDLKDIDIEVKNCVARLTGTVPSGAQQLEAAVVARSTAGVCSVQDDLRIAN